MLGRTLVVLGCGYSGRGMLRRANTVHLNGGSTSPQLVGSPGGYRYVAGPVS